MNDTNRQRRHDDLAAPAKLVAALAGLHRNRVSVPPAVDEMVMREARTHLRSAAHRQQGRGRLGLLRDIALVFSTLTELKKSNWLRFAPWAAAAAVLVVGVWLAPTVFVSRAAQRAGDVNRDGQVDMLDVLALARQIQRGEKPGTQYDLNGDGMIDRRDVDVLAARAVRVEKGTQS